MDIILKSTVLEVKKVLNKTKAEMFKDLKVGDRIELSIPVKYAGSNGGSYASYIKAENITTRDANYSSFNQMPSKLLNFEFINVE